jgi:hypothetical protein
MVNPPRELECVRAQERRGRSGWCHSRFGGRELTVQRAQGRGSERDDGEDGERGERARHQRNAELHRQPADRRFGLLASLAAGIRGDAFEGGLQRYSITLVRAERGDGRTCRLADVAGEVLQRVGEPLAPAEPLAQSFARGSQRCRRDLDARQERLAGGAARGDPCRDELEQVGQRDRLPRRLEPRGTHSPPAVDDDLHAQRGETEERVRDGRQARRGDEHDTAPPPPTHTGGRR